MVKLGHGLSFSPAFHLRGRTGKDRGLLVGIENNEVRNHGRLGNVRILVVEDNADLWALTRYHLEKEGAQASRACNGRQAVDQVIHGHFRLVLMDIQMPEMDGLQATRELRALGFQEPILALTAHNQKRDFDLSFESGCDGHLVKPIGSSILIERIIAELQRKQAGDHKQNKTNLIAADLK
jgi:CheY-like chemotaxis protein